MKADFTLYGKKHTAIGFQNKSGGYELGNEHFIILLGEKPSALCGFYLSPDV
jgi:hypothetical protein